VRVDFCRASQFHPLVCLVVANINTSTPFKVDVGMLEFLHAMVAMAAPCITVLVEEEEAAVMVMELRVVVVFLTCHGGGLSARGYKGTFE
jgi:hypothetical protein